MKPLTRKRIIVSVTNDLVSDNRVHKVCSTLTKMGFEVLLVGRKFKRSLDTGTREYAVRRFRLFFNKGPLFYACYNIRLFSFLLFHQFDLVLSNDLDTLTANFLASRIKKKPLVYDSHEYFTEVPELVNRPGIRRIWEWLEKRMVPSVNAAYSVCSSIARIYSEKYQVPFLVVRNFPFASKGKYDNKPAEEGNLILYQGAVNEGRGLEHAIRAIKLIKDVRLVIAGDGDKRQELEELVKDEELSGRVKFSGRLSIEELAALTPKAAVGLSIEEDIGLNYHYALPNKLFDYIQAQVPVLVTNLPEMAAVVRHYDIGEVISDSDPRKLALTLTEMTGNAEKRNHWKKNLKKAAQELVWENEEKIIQNIFKPYL